MMRFLCIGAGAVGGYLGGSLMAAGEDITFYVKENQLTDIREQGIRLVLGERKLQLFHHTDCFLERVLRDNAFDAVILSIKSYDMDDFIQQAFPYKHLFPPLICMLNGVENEEKLGSSLGLEKIISGSLISAVKRMPDGWVILEKLRGMGLASLTVPLNGFVEVFNRAGLNSKQFANPLQMKWSKLITNLPANATSAILNMSPGQILSSQAIFQLEVAQLLEAFNVMKASGIQAVNLPHAPVRLIEFLVRKMPSALSQPFMYWGLGKGRGGKMPSFHMDLYSGKKRSEVDYLNGAIVRFGAKTGVSTPVNRFLRDTLIDLVEGRTALDYYQLQPQKLVEAFHRSGAKK